MSGVGFLLPYNSFVTAVDFFQDIFPGTTIIFDISLVYILTALIAVLLNNVIIETFSLQTRMMFGYLVSLTVLLTFLMLVWSEVLTTDQSYGLVLLLVSVLSLAATVQQSSIYGLTGLLPARYSQAVMTGESECSVSHQAASLSHHVAGLAGCLACVNRILSKLVVENTTTSTGLFILLSSLLLVICCYNFYKVTPNRPNICY